jgi:flagellin-like hook-associated protein FlgL
MSDIVLSAGVRSNLLQLQQTSDLISQTQTRLATGKRVNSALDNAINFFTAQGLDNRANDLNGLLDSMSNGINTIQAANNGITAITKLVQSAQALTSQANQTTDTTVRATLASQFDALVTQIGQLATDSGFNGINLLAGDTLTVVLDETGASSTSVVGVNYTDATAAEHRDFSGQLGHVWQHSDGKRRFDRSTHVVAFRVADPQRKLVDRADPSGFHQGDNQHAADGLCSSHARRLERGRRQPACLADPPAAVDHSSVVGLASRPERPPPVPVSRTAIGIKRRPSGRRFFCASRKRS